MTLHFRPQPNGRFVALRVVEGETRRPAFQKLGVGGPAPQPFAADADAAISPEETALIEAYADRLAQLAQTEAWVEARRLPLRMRQTARWLAGASDAEIEGLADELLLTLFELREAVLKRRAAGPAADAPPAG